MLEEVRRYAGGGVEGGWIANAAVDVFAKEPLDKESRFYSEEEVRKMDENGVDVRAAICFRNLERYGRDGRLVTGVNKEKGY